MRIALIISEPGIAVATRNTKNMRAAPGPPVAERPNISPSKTESSLTNPVASDEKFLLHPFLATPKAM